MHKMYCQLQIDFFGKLIRFLVIIFLSVLLLLPGISSADSFYPNSGVDTTDEAYTISLHHGQCILNTEWDCFADAPSSTATFLAIKYGIAENLDIGIQLPYTDIFEKDDVNRGFNDAQFGLKYRFTPPMEKRILLAAIISAKPATFGPINDQNNGVLDFSSHLIGTYKINKWQYNANYGYSFWGNIPDNTRKPSPFYKLETTYNCSENYSLSGEVYGQKGPYVSPLQATIKMSYQFRPQLTLDLGIASGLNNDAPLRRYLMGLTWDI